MMAVSGVEFQALAQRDERVQISARRFNFFYGKFHALKDINLDMYANRVTAFIGPSGCGKSTLLRALNRMYALYPEQRAEGELTLDGRNILDPDFDAIELRRRACLVPQLPAPLPGSVAHNVRYGPSLRGDEVDPGPSLEQAGLDEGYAERDASRLSVGEQQRVMLARALALRPEALLLDEPTSALDERARAGVEATLLDLARGGLSMVVVTHDRGQAERLADRVVEMP